MAAIDILRDILAKRKKPVQAEPSTLGTQADISPRQPEVVTLGGTEDVSPMASRPRIVPDAPVRDYVVNPSAQPGYSDDDRRMMQDLLASKPADAQSAAAVDYSDPRQRIKAIESKDYSIAKDPNTGEVIHRGKDRDKEWSLGDKVLSGLIAMTRGEGFVTGATDRNYREKLSDKQELSGLYGSVQRQQKMEQADLANQQQAAQNEYLAVRPELEQQKIENAAEAKQRDYELKARTQGWKEEDRVEYYRLEREKLEALKQNRADLHELAVRRQTEIERNNRATEAGRNRRAEMREGGLRSRQQISIEAKRIADEIKAAEKMKQIERAGQLRVQLQQLKDEYDQN